MKKIKEWLCQHEWYHVGVQRCRHPKWCNVGMHYCNKCKKMKKGKFK